MKLLFVHAHFDDFEFTAAGTFELWRRKCADVHRRVLVCTDGAAGHHAMSRAATAARRLAEQQEAAVLGEFDFRLLRDRSGSPFREARLGVAPDFLPALWREIRDFEPDYLFCPPIPDHVLAGVHVDHLDVAQAVRSVAYMVNVPHAFSPEFPGTEVGPFRSVRTPVILNTYDGYMAGGHGHDLAIDIGDVCEHVADLAWCHASQLREWLPWVNRHNLVAPPDLATWREQFRTHLDRRKAALGIRAPGVFEVFNVTAWGAVPTLKRLLEDFPAISEAGSNLERLASRVSAWRVANGDEAPTESVLPAASATVRRPPSVEVAAPTNPDRATLVRRLEFILGGPPGFNTGAKAEILADLLCEFGAADLAETLRLEWVSKFDTGPDSSPSVLKVPGTVRSRGREGASQ